MQKDFTHIKRTRRWNFQNELNRSRKTMSLNNVTEQTYRDKAK